MASTVLGFDATTLHHLSGIRDGRLTEYQLGTRYISDDRFVEAQKRIYESDVLVIDEIWMLSECVFNKIEYSAGWPEETTLFWGPSGFFFIFV